MKEVQFLRRCDHDNCVRYLGCYLKAHSAWVGGSTLSLFHYVSSARTVT